MTSPAGSSQGEKTIHGVDIGFTASPFAGILAERARRLKQKLEDDKSCGVSLFVFSFSRERKRKIYLKGYTII